MTRFLAGLDFDEREAAGNGGGKGHVRNRQDVDELINVGFDAMGGALADGRNDGHARDAGPLGMAYGERLDIVAPTAKKRGDAVEHAGLIFDVDDEGMLLFALNHWMGMGWA